MPGLHFYHGAADTAVYVLLAALVVILVMILLYYIARLRLQLALSQQRIQLAAANPGFNQFGQALGAIQHRLGIIDKAQQQIENLSTSFANLNHMLGSKQQRGFYGEQKLEAIIRDELSAGQYAMQFTLSTRVRPDCVLFLPHDKKPLAIDSKFPLESFASIHEATGRGEKLRAEIAHKSFLSDMKKHITDISRKYIIAGETQDMAFIFLPAESIYVYIAQECSTLLELASREHVVLTSPNSLMLAVKIVQSMMREVNICNNARLIQSETGALLQEIAKLAKQTSDVQRHFTMCENDLGELAKACLRISRRGEKIEHIAIDG